MSRSTVLSTAAALHVFTAGQVAAYCDEDQAAVLDVLREHDELFERLPGAGVARWRVTDLAALRAAITAPDRPATSPAPRAPHIPGSLETRLLLAEQTLIDCALEKSPADRRVMAATAANYLRQFLAGAMESQRHVPWWDIGPSYLDSIERVAADGTTVSRCRLVTDFALARLTETEAAHESVGKGFLVDTAAELSRLLGSREMEAERAQRLSGWFTTLAMELTSPPAVEEGGAGAPARLLCALAWKRAEPAAQGGWEAAARARVELLRGFAAHDPRDRAGDTAHLYRVMDPLKHGRRRVAVYQDLIDLLPSEVNCEPEEELLPGAVVAAVTDADAARLLQYFAQILEQDLTSSPYLSVRAHVGQVAHRFDEFQARIGNDHTAVARSIRVRKELLTLFDVSL